MFGKLKDRNFATIREVAFLGLSILLQQTQFKVILYSTFFGLSALLASCGNSKQIEGFFSADPNLIAETTATAETSEDTSTQVANSESDNREGTNNIRLTKLPKDRSTSDGNTNSDRDSNDIAQGNSNNSSSASTEESASTVPELPDNLPFYPQATLEAIDPESNEQRGVSKWRSQDDIGTIVNYYREKWQAEEWEIIRPFAANEDNNRTEAIIRQDNLNFKVSLAPLDAEGEENEGTNLEIAYGVATALNSTDNEENETENTATANSDNEESNTVATNRTKTSKTNSTNSNSFADLTEVPEPLRDYVRDLGALGIIGAKTKEEETNAFQFQPNETITRREYARWLVRANNKYYGDSPRKKIHLANKSSNVAFKDVNTSDRDFAAIQGLAEAGLIPSSLSGDTSNLLFQPDAPLTREDLITWKVPLDTRKPLPKADLAAIREAWGFQDANNIDPKALPALFADYQNSDRSNISRIFGYTTLLQPKKAVTRAEAAASLWYFGFQADGITAKEALKVEKESS